MTIDELKSLLSRFHIRPDKRLGQNFLLSEEVLDQIVAAADLTRNDTVLEIGPGLGFLTKRLAEKAGEVVAVEKDRKLTRVLHKVFKNYKNVKLIQGDALFLNSSVIASGAAPLSLRGVSRSNPVGNEIASSPPVADPRNDKTTYKLVANIPYYLTGKILQKFLTPSPRRSSGAPSPASSDVTSRARGEGNNERPSLMVLLLQKEVAERIVARPGEMSLLSVSVQFYSDPEIIEFVSKENFYPVPEVDSAIVKLAPLLARGGEGEGFRSRFDVDEKKFFQLVKIGFANKRKQLQNNLTSLPSSLLHHGGQVVRREEPASVPSPGEGRVARLPAGRERLDYKTLLSSLGLNPLCRAQDLSLEDWKQLYTKLFTPSFISSNRLYLTSLPRPGEGAEGRRGRTVSPSSDLRSPSPARGEGKNEESIAGGRKERG